MDWKRGRGSSMFFRTLPRALFTFPILALIECGGGNNGSGTPPPPATFTLSLSPTQIALSQERHAERAGTGLFRQWLLGLGHRVGNRLAVGRDSRTPDVD